VKRAKVIAVPELGEDEVLPPHGVPAQFALRHAQGAPSTPVAAAPPAVVSLSATALPAPAPPRTSAPFKGVLVSSRQKDNHVLSSLKNVSYRFEDRQGQLSTDFHINSDVGILFLSLRYHMMNRRYILGRLDNMLGYKQRILLVHCDTEGADAEMVELATDCIVKNATLIVAWSELECARYIEAFKVYEGNTADSIKGVQSKEFEDVFGKCLTSVRSVNSSDVLHLGTTFQTMQKVAQATTEELLLCPGLWTKKARRLYDCFHQPFNHK